MKPMPRIGVIIFTLFLSSCVQPTMYVDPQYRTASYSDIKPVKEKYKTNLSVEWQTNGKHIPELDEMLRNNSKRILRATGVVEPVDDPVSNKMKITFNNVADRSSAAGKGFGVGLTFGAIGTTVSDFYEVKIIAEVGGKKITKNLKHAIHTTIGNAAPPIGMRPVAASEAIVQLIEDVILNFMKQMQGDNLFIDGNQPESGAKVSLLSEGTQYVRSGIFTADRNAGYAIR